MNIITLGYEIYPFLGKHWAFVGILESDGKNILTKNMVYTHVFHENYKNLWYFWKKCKK